jgi:hypothetical protein
MHHIGLNPQPETRNPKPETRNPIPETLKELKPETLKELDASEFHELGFSRLPRLWHKHPLHHHGVYAPTDKFAIEAPFTDASTLCPHR